jgi:hypothetical protein
VPHAGESARFYQKQFALTKWRASITSAPVFKLPGYPGPYGDKVFYLVVPSDELAIEWTATKKYVENERVPTGYDAVIEKILATFKSPK